MSGTLKSHKYLLTIAIPTYNRAEYLERNLRSLYLQINGKEMPLEIIVSDNCSSDLTQAIVKNFIDDGMPIKYIRNSENYGAELNVIKCYKLALGEYVLVLGDDDILYDGAIDLILQFIREGNYGVVHLKPNAYSKDYRISENISYKCCSINTFISKVTYWVTFISSNIVNRKYVKEIDFSFYLGLNLPQVPLILHAALNAEKNLFIETALIGVEPENSGGYNLFTVFGRNLMKILNTFLDKPKKDLIINKMLIEFFPYLIIKMRQKGERFKFNSSGKELRESFSSFLFYWLFDFPIEILPLNLATKYLRIERYIKKLIYKG
ncbi:MAG: glycosyltransferase family 2 protein [Fibrobacter sp.]|jgi:abequosyltransferase|nr:glycosyltransferase family 2 protein [Fibrobacter sp.]